MKKTNKKALGEMIGEMLQVEDLNTNQLQIIDMLCKINESSEIASETAYSGINGKWFDEFEDFVVENDDEIWDVFNACKTFDKSGEIAKLVLLNAKKMNEEEEKERGIEQEDSRIIVNFKYVNGIPKFCYVRIVYEDKEKGGNIVKSLYNWDDEGDYWAFPFDKIESHNKKSDFFIKLMLD